MFVVTNRHFDEGKAGLKRFGDVPNPKGPNELRFVRVSRTGNKYRADLLDDELPKAEVALLKQKFNLKIDEKDKWYRSLKVACEINEEARRTGRHILLYVHGYNNDMSDVIGTCLQLEKLYKVTVVPFSWPANGGGVTGTAAYLSDKQDARASADALNRTIEKLAFYHEKLTEGGRERLKKKASAKFPDNPTAWQQYYTELLEADCKIRISMMCHSMGNYLLKYALTPAASPARRLIFDNIGLVAADANNEDHQKWVEALQVRNRLYIVINENDFALQWSRRKPGDEQKARLGHYLKNLVARNPYYVNVTNASWVKKEHSYFCGKPVGENSKLKNMFSAILEGGVAEELLRFRSEGNFYVLR